jgi:hypothetical protein
MRNILTLLVVLFFATTTFAQDKPKQGPRHNANEQTESRQAIPENVAEMWKKRREEMQRMHGVRPNFEGERPNFNGARPNFYGPQHGFGGMRPPVGYMPMVVWLPQGMHMGVGPVVVSPDRRYVRLGINAGFYHIPQVHTFNYSNGR